MKKKGVLSALMQKNIKNSYSQLEQLLVQAYKKFGDDPISRKKLDDYKDAVVKKVQNFQKNPSNGSEFLKSIKFAVKGLTLQLNQKTVIKVIDSSQKERVALNIPTFNSLIGGGFTRNSTNLILGATGSGKTIFAMHFILEGLKNGEKCLFVTFEEKKKNFYSNMKDLGWDLQDYEDKRLFTFLEYTPNKVKSMLEEGGGAIESIILKEHISRMVIDSMTSFSMLFNSELEKRESSLSFFNMISKWNCTTLLTFEEDPLNHEKSEAEIIEFESDSIILLYFVRKGGARYRFLEVLKMRGTSHSKKLYQFFIEKGGFNISKNPITKLPI